MKSVASVVEWSGSGEDSHVIRNPVVTSVLLL